MLYRILLISFSIFILPYLLLVLFIRLIINKQRCDSNICMVDKTVVITGGNKGIGLETTLALAARGCKIIIGCRTKSERLRNHLIKKTHNPNILMKHLDLASIDSVKKFAKEISDSEKSIDILINNAAICKSKQKRTPDGLNSVIQVNYLGHFLLSHLLIDLLKKGSQPKILFITSFLCFYHDLKKNLEPEVYYSPVVTKETFWDDLRIYANTKTSVICTANWLSEKLKSSNIMVNSVCPGIIVESTIYKQFLTSHVNKMVLFLLYSFCYPLMKTPVQATQPILKAAIDANFSKVSGRLIWDYSWFTRPRCSRNRDFCKSHMRATEKVLGITSEKYF